MSTPINVRTEFGHRWQIGLDEPAAGRWKDPWNFKVICRYGDISPWGGDLLAASTHTAGAVANRLMKLAGVTVVHDGDDGATVVFPASMVRTVAALMKPRSVRRATPAQAAALQRGRVTRQRPP
jgi:hypothetical protein